MLKEITDSDIHSLVHLVRGGLPLKEASKTLGFGCTKVRYTLMKRGIKVMGLRPTARRIKDSSIQNIYDAIKLALEGASPEVIYLLTNVTLRQVKNKCAEMEKDAIELLSLDQEQPTVLA